VKMAKFPTFEGSWPWPWVESYCIPSCITHRPLPTYQFTEFRWNRRNLCGQTGGRTFETHFTRSTRRSRPKSTL